MRIYHDYLFVVRASRAQSLVFLKLQTTTTMILGAHLHFVSIPAAAATRNFLLLHDSTFSRKVWATRLAKTKAASSHA